MFNEIKKAIVDYFNRRPKTVIDNERWGKLYRQWLRLYGRLEWIDMSHTPSAKELLKIIDKINLDEYSEEELAEYLAKELRQNHKNISRKSTKLIQVFHSQLASYYMKAI